MELIIKILTGKRKNREIKIPRLDSSEINTELLSILENESFSFHLKLDKFYDEVILLLGDISYNFSYESDENNESHYILMPKKTKNGYESLFHNYFGIAHIDIKISLNNKIELIHFFQIDVLACKITVDQTYHMLEYIINESNESLSCLSSATRYNAKYIEGGESPKTVFDKLNNLISILEDILPSIANRPLTRVSSETRMQNGYQTKDIDEQGLGWLNENLSVLEETDDFEKSHIFYDGIYYIAKEIQTPIIVEHTDIYENRVIYGFLLKVKHFTLDIERYISITKKNSNTINLQEDGYVSFFSIIGNLTSKKIGIDLRNVVDCYSRITKLINLLDKKLPVTMIDDGLPIITQKVRSNRFYSSVFRAMVEWYKYNKIDWRSYEILLAIKDIPTLFEYYTMLKIKSELISICENVDFNKENEAILSCIFKKSNINLYYQPHYWMVGHQNIKDAKYLRTEISKMSFNRTSAVDGFKKSNHKHSNRVPDIVIEVTKFSGERLLFIFDAKYSTMETAYKEYLHDCAIKYIHGINGIEGTSPVKSMILVCPTQNVVTLADIHAPPYDLHSDKAVFPIIGVQGIDLIAKKNEEMEITIKDTINRLLNIFTD